MSLYSNILDIYLYLDNFILTFYKSIYILDIDDKAHTNRYITHHNLSDKLFNILDEYKKCHFIVVY